MTSNAIRRARPDAIRGKAGITFPAFIHNSRYFFTELDVYEDGLVECWGAVDLDCLAEKIESGWIVPAVPDGADFSIHGVIQATVVSGRWSQDAQALHRRLLDALDCLNPRREDLVDFEGDDVELRNGVRYAKVGMMKATPVRAALGEGSPPGKSRNALVRRDGLVFLTAIRVYADGQIDVHPRYGEEQLVDFAAFEQMVAAGDVVTTVADGTTIEIDTLGRFEVTNVWAYVCKPADFVQEIAEIIGELRGQPDSVAQCRAAYQQYLADPTIKHREALRQAYESVPEHHRIYVVGDMDTKDVPVRMIIYGDQELEHWSHRVVARAQGDEHLPTIEVPKPRDENPG